MAIILRNKRTHEIKTVEAESDEYFDLIGEVYDPGDGTAKTAWEQQGYHSAEAPEMAESGTTVQSHGPELEPHKELTAGEREVGIKSYDQKVKSYDKNKVQAGKELKTPRRGRSAPAGRKAEGEKTELNQRQGEPTTPVTTAAKS